MLTAEEWQLSQLQESGKRQLEAEGETASTAPSSHKSHGELTEKSSCR